MTLVKCSNCGRQVNVDVNPDHCPFCGHSWGKLIPDGGIAGEWPSAVDHVVVGGPRVEVPGAAPEEVDCDRCSGHVRPVRVDRQDSSWIVHYRCKDGCRGGGHVVVDRWTGEEQSRGGPVFEEGSP